MEPDGKRVLNCLKLMMDIELVQLSNLLLLLLLSVLFSSTICSINAAD